MMNQSKFGQTTIVDVYQNHQKNGKTQTLLRKSNVNLVWQKDKTTDHQKRVMTILLLTIGQ